MDPLPSPGAFRLAAIADEIIWRWLSPRARAIALALILTLIAWSLPRERPASGAHHPHRHGRPRPDLRWGMADPRPAVRPDPVGGQDRCQRHSGMGPLSNRDRSRQSKRSVREAN